MCVVVFEDTLENKQKDISHVLTRGRRKIIEVFWSSQRYFELPLLIRDNSSNVNLFKQSAKKVKNYSIDKAGFDLGYEELKQFCREAWIKTHNHLKLLDWLMKKYNVFVPIAKKKRKFLKL